MLQKYDKALMASVLALAALTPIATAETGGLATAAGCDLSDGYSSGVAAFAREASACLATPATAGQLAIMTDVMTLTDRARQKEDMAPLIRRASLDEAARAHALDMAATGYASHGDPDGRSHRDRVHALDRTGIYGAMGANVIVVDASAGAIDIYSMLTSDSVNADNMVRRAFTHGGMGVAEADGQLYVVQVFGQLDGELSEALPVGLPASASVDVLFHSDGFTQSAWLLEDDDGRRVRRGTVNHLKRTGAEDGDVSLVIEAERGGAVHTLTGPTMSALDTPSTPQTRQIAGL